MTSSRMLNLYNWILRPFPFFGGRLKKIFLRACGVNVHKSAFITSDVTVLGECGNISIGEKTVLRHGCCLECSHGTLEIGARCEVNFGTLIAANCGSKIIIGDDVHIAHNVSIKGSTHEIDVHGESIAGESKFLDIRIGSGSWICAGATILPGVTIGRRNVIAAGAVVTKSTPDSVLMAGVPAVIKKKYGTEEIQ